MLMALTTGSPARDSTAVVIIDMQQRFFQNLKWHSKQEILAAHIQLLEECAEFDIPVAVIEYSGFGPTMGEITAALRAVPRNSWYAKTAMSAFSGSWLEGYLEGLGVSTILLTGIYASQCVLETAQWAPKKYHLCSSDVLIADHLADPRIKATCEWFRNNGSFYSGYISPRSIECREVT
jgi:isochorismate hydrolase